MEFILMAIPCQLSLSFVSQGRTRGESFVMYASYTVSYSTLLSVLKLFIPNFHSEFDIEVQLHMFSDRHSS